MKKQKVKKSEISSQEINNILKGYIDSSIQWDNEIEISDVFSVDEINKLAGNESPAWIKYNEVISTDKNPWLKVISVDEEKNLIEIYQIWDNLSEQENKIISDNIVYINTITSNTNVKYKEKFKVKKIILNSEKKIEKFYEKQLPFFQTKIDDPLFQNQIFDNMTYSIEWNIVINAAGINSISEIYRNIDLDN